MPKKIRSTPHKSVEQLRKEYSNRNTAQQIGRAVLSAQILQVAHNLRELDDSLVTINAPATPSIVYFHESWLKDLPVKSLSSSDRRLGLPPDSGVPNIIRLPHELLAAIFASPFIDKEAASISMELAIKKIRAKRNPRRTSNTYNVALVAYDRQNVFYKDGYTLRGESDVLGKVRNSGFEPPQINPDNPLPTHYIKLAEVTVMEQAKIDPEDVVETLRRGIGAMVGSVVEVSPIQLIG